MDKEEPCNILMIVWPYVCMHVCMYVCLHVCIGIFFSSSSSFLLLVVLDLHVLTSVPSFHIIVSSSSIINIYVITFLCLPSKNAVLTCSGRLVCGLCISSMSSLVRAPSSFPSYMYVRMYVLSHHALLLVVVIIILLLVIIILLVSEEGSSISSSSSTSS